jgi:histone-lysine N-methyltransferase SETMAR
VEELIQWDRHVTVDNVATEVGIGHVLAHKLIHDILQYRKALSRWVPRQLTPDHKAQQMGTSLQHLLCYKTEGNAFLFQIVTGDKSWVHHFTPESKAASMAWKNMTSPVRKKTTPSAGKVLLTVYWDAEGVLLLDFLERGRGRGERRSVNAERYCETLTRLKNAIRRKRPGLLTAGVILLHDNVRPHMAAVMANHTATFGWERLDHAPYSPDLAPRDFHFFPTLKRTLEGRCFTTNENVEAAVQTFVCTQDTDFYQQGFFKLMKRWDKCISVSGDYVEK